LNPVLHATKRPHQCLFSVIIVKQAALREMRHLQGRDQPRPPSHQTNSLESTQPAAVEQIWRIKESQGTDETANTSRARLPSSAQHQSGGKARFAALTNTTASRQGQRWDETRGL